MAKAIYPEHQEPEKDKDHCVVSSTRPSYRKEPRSPMPCTVALGRDLKPYYGLKLSMIMYVYVSSNYVLVPTFMQLLRVLLLWDIRSLWATDSTGGAH